VGKNVEDAAIIDLKKARARESKARSRANQAEAQHAAGKKRNRNAMARWRSKATPEQRGAMWAMQHECMNRRNKMRREERALINHHTKKDEEDSVNCVNVLGCTTSNNIGNKDNGNDNNNNWLEAVTKNAINQQQSEEKLRELRSDDANTVRRNGALTRATDLNLPHEWIFSSPWGYCTPVHISGEHEDNHDNASNTLNTSDISDASNGAKNGSNNHPRGVRGIRAIGVFVVTSIGNEDNDELVFGGQAPINVLNHLPIA
jgi:hypothetical protein